MAATAPADSRLYRFAFIISSTNQWPSGFESPERREGFRKALFLPGDHEGWFRHFSRLPRLIVLYADAMDIHMHPASQEQTVHIPLCSLRYVEDGHILLQSWLKFVWAQCDVALFYNTCNRRVVDRFLRELRRAFAPQLALDAPLEMVSLGAPLDLKFENARQSEIIFGEYVYAQLFHPAERKFLRSGIFHREYWNPANLLLATNCRLVWVTDWHEGRREKYGNVTRYAPMCLIESAYCEPMGKAAEVTFRFRGDRSWRIALPLEFVQDANDFLAILTDLRRKLCG